MLKFIYNKIDVIFLSSILILIVLPLLYLSIYNHPYSDDYGLMMRAKGTNPFKIAYDFYFQWSGSYIGVFIQSILMPTEMIGFKIVPFFIILLFLISFYYITDIFFQQVFSVNEKIGVSLVGFALFFMQMDFPAETLYWVMSAMAYQTGYLLFALFISMIILWLRQKYIFSSNRWHYSLLILLSIITTGHIANVSVLVVGTCGLLVIYTFFKHKYLFSHAIILLLFSLIGFAIFFFAPGNFVRSDFTYREDTELFLNTILSAKMYISHLSLWFSNSFFILTTFIFIFLVLEKKVISTANVPSILMFIITLGVSYSFMFLPHYTVGYVSARHIDMSYLFFLIGWFITIFYLISDLVVHDILSLPCFSKNYIKIACLLGIFLLFLPNANSNGRKVLEDVLRGTAKNFDNEMNQRYQMALRKKGEGIKYIVFDSLKYRPFMLFKQEMSVSTKHWYNQGFSAYFGVDSVMVTGGHPLYKPKKKH